MRLFYCPKCGKEQISKEDLYKGEYAVANIRDGYGRPIRHYKCECGNYLAGSMDVTGWEDDKGSILYAKDVIKGYNLGGCYYESNYPNECNLLERAKRCYEEKMKRFSDRMRSE